MSGLIQIDDIDRDDDYFDDFEASEAEDELEEAMANCGMMHNGLCMYAGSEQCDWECPFSQ